MTCSRTLSPKHFPALNIDAKIYRIWYAFAFLNVIVTMPFGPVVNLG